MGEYRENDKLVWVAPNSIHYSLEHIEWLLPQLISLREGRYPPEPRDSGYVGIQRRITERAPYELICQIAAEIDIRLARTWPDCDLVEMKYCHGYTEAEIASRLYRDEFEIYKRIRSAITYIASGPVPRWITTEKRKGITYQEWVNNRRRQWLKHRELVRR